MPPSKEYPHDESNFGGYKVEARPDPIPNSAVKLNIADGSACKACARVGSRLFFHSKPLFT